jgi:hypothetical protein
VDEVKHELDSAVAMQAYAPQAKNPSLEFDCAEIRMRAERRLGEMEGMVSRGRMSLSEAKTAQCGGSTQVATYTPSTMTES